MINQRIMGRTGLKLSELCLGTLNFGWNTGQAAAFEVLDAYHAAGGNFIQASVDAPALSLPSASPSLSEELTGRWWHSRSIPRGELVLATRLRLRQPASSAVSFATIMQEQCQQSLRRMKTTYIDIAVFEWNDGLLPIRDTLAAFDGLVRSGMVRYIVAANFPTWRIADALSQAYARNQCRMEALQADYSLMTRARFEPEAMALCAAQRSGFFARSPLAAEAEGVALWSCPDGDGYWVAVDQLAPLTTFHLFERDSLAPRGSFQGKATAYTDGIALDATASPRFPGGALYAVDNDVAVTAFDLRDVAATLGLDPSCVN